MNSFLSFFLAYCLLTVLYRFAVRPFLQSAIRERIEQREIELNELLECGKLSKDDFCYQFLARHCDLKNRLDDFSISDFVYFLFCKDIPDNLFDDLKRFYNEAATELKIIHDALCKDSGLWLIINSPIYSIIVAAIIMGAVLLRYMDESKIKRRAQVFVNAEASSCLA